MVCYGFSIKYYPIVRLIIYKIRIFSALVILLEFFVQNKLSEIKTVLDVERLKKKLSTNKPVIAIWATYEPRSTLDILLYLYKELCARGKQVIFLLRENAIQYFLTMKQEVFTEHIYIFDDIQLLAHSRFIDLLITHDFCIGNRPPPQFKAKVLLFPHNMICQSPDFTNCWSDYIISPKNNASNFDYMKMPYQYKINILPSCNVILGYPKLDLLIKERKQVSQSPNKKGNKLHKLVTFFLPSFSHVGCSYESTMENKTRWSALIKSFFEIYPDWYFVVRPYKADIAHPIVKALYNECAHYTGFILDTGDDNKKYLIEADYFITESSTVHFNFALATLRPSILFVTSFTRHMLSSSELPIDPCQTELTRTETGYLVYSNKQVIVAIADALNSQTEWEENILAYRNNNFPNAGNFIPYLADHIDLCIQGKSHKDWIVIDKGAPLSDSNKVSNWLKALNCTKLESSDNICNYFIYNASVSFHGHNPKIALAYLRLAMHTLMQFASKPEYEPEILGISIPLVSVFNSVPPSQIFGLLCYILKKNPDNIHARISIMFAIILWRNKDEILNHIIYLYGKNLCTHHIRIIQKNIYPTLQNLYINNNDIESLLMLLQTVLIKNPSLYSHQLTLNYIALLHKYNKFDPAQEIFKKWNLSDDTEAIKGFNLPLHDLTLAEYDKILAECKKKLSFEIEGTFDILCKKIKSYTNNSF